MELVRSNAVGHVKGLVDDSALATASSNLIQSTTLQQQEEEKHELDTAAKNPTSPPAAAPAGTTTTVTEATLAAQVMSPPVVATTTTTTTTTPTISTVTPSPPPPRATPSAVETLEFHAAIAAGDVSSVEAYIDQNADGDRYTADLTAAHSSGLGAMLAVSGVGQEAGSALEARDRRGRTPLHTACAEGRVKVMRVLLRAGANVNALDRAGYNPLHRCAQAGNADTTRTLLEHRGATTADVDAPTRRGDYRPLHLACLSGSSDVVILLAERAAEVSAGDKWGCTPLHRACLEGKLAAVRAILDAGAEIDARDEWKSTPLHRACSNAHPEIVDLLLRQGASLSARDDLMERPGQRFGDDVSSERRMLITALLTERADNDGVSGNVTTSGWSRTRSADSASAGAPGEQRTTNRYIPPGARKYSSPVAAAEAPEGGGRSGGSVVQPWRRRTSTWSGLSEERGPDIGEDGRATGDDADADADAGAGAHGGGFAAVELASGGPPGGAGRGATNSGISGGLLSMADFGDAHPDVFSGGDDWGALSFDGSQPTTAVVTNRADA